MVRRSSLVSHFVAARGPGSGSTCFEDIVSNKLKLFGSFGVTTAFMKKTHDPFRKVNDFGLANAIDRQLA